MSALWRGCTVSTQRVAISGRDCTAHRGPPLRCGGGLLRQLRPPRARPASVTNLQRGRHRCGPTGARSLGVGRPAQQADGAVVGTHAASVGLWLRSGSELQWTVPGAGAHGAARSAHLCRAGQRRAASGGERARRNRWEGGRTPAVDACGRQCAGDRICHSAGARIQTLGGDFRRPLPGISGA